MASFNKVKSGHTAEIVYCGLFTALMAAGAFIKIVLPLGVFEVTVSLQIFFAVMAGLILGPRMGTMSVLAYIVIGLTGIPVFAHGGGPAYIMRPTFGFITGFAFAAFIAGYVSDKTKRHDFRTYAAAAVAGELIYYTAGLIYFYIMFNYVLTGGMHIGIRELMVVWCFSTIVPDTIICVFAAALAPRIRQAAACRKD